MNDFLGSLQSSISDSSKRRRRNEYGLQNMLKAITETTNQLTSQPLDPGRFAPKVAPVAASPAQPASSGGSGVAQGGGTKGGFDANFSSALNRLLKDFGGKVTIKSGYRSPERQAQLWANALKKYGSAAAARKWVAPPGKSNHGRGLAADLGYADAATRALVHANAAKYGLVFPLANENWHIEPINARKRK